MEATLGWMPWLEPLDSKIVWMRPSGERWKEICWEVGLARAAAHEHWLYALCVIAWRLNGKERVKHIGRRRLIARVRFGASDETLDVRDVWNPTGSRHGGGWLLCVLTLVGDVIPSDAKNR